MTKEQVNSPISNDESSALIEHALSGYRLNSIEAGQLAEVGNIDQLVTVAGTLRDMGHGNTISFSRNVFIPLTRLCSDVCHYCTFAKSPDRDEKAFLTVDEVLDIARAGLAAGCREALFTLGDKPEIRYGRAREELAELGHATTLSYLSEMAEVVLRETGLLPHLNPGIMNDQQVAQLRSVSVSMGLMLETISRRLSEKGGPHFGSPDKDPDVRLASIAAAGRQAVPFTTGLLIGIGETRHERIDALLALRDLHDQYGHIQEVIIQNFDPKPGTRMAYFPPPDEFELVWTIAVARLILGPAANIQTPPNLNPGRLIRLVAAGINDWGGVSPITPDHVNPEHAWPTLKSLEDQTAQAGKALVERLAIYPDYALRPEQWLDRTTRTPTIRETDSTGFARIETWRTGVTPKPPKEWNSESRTRAMLSLDGIISRAVAGNRLDEQQIVRLFGARGSEVAEICDAADHLRRTTVGDDVTFVINRNINYTNICEFRCAFCAFSKGRTTEHLRGRPYNFDIAEIEVRTAEAWERGATEVCLQGGIHPSYTGNTYLEICRAVKKIAPEIHVHAFSPLEIWQGAKTLNRSVEDFLEELITAGLGSLPGTAAEILDDEVRSVICPDKIDTQTWLSIIATAHRLGLPTTSTIMFGHVDRPVHWARHLLRLRDLQAETGGITEFVPLPFVAQEAPIFLKGQARPGPTFRECMLMHAVARLVLHTLIHNIQTSWVKMGPEGAVECLKAGANDFGGILMNESITRAAGASHGQELAASEMIDLIRGIGRNPRQRTTTYDIVVPPNPDALENPCVGGSNPPLGTILF